jgi:hypothetical protein
MRSEYKNPAALWQKLLLVALLGALFFVSVAVPEPPTESCCDLGGDEKLIISPSTSFLALGGGRGFAVYLESRRQARFERGGIKGHFVHPTRTQMDPLQGLNGALGTEDRLTVDMKSLTELSQPLVDEVRSWFAMSEAEREEWHDWRTTWDFLTHVLPFVMGPPVITFEPMDNLVYVTANYPAEGDKKAGSARGRVLITLNAKESPGLLPPPPGP